MATSRLSLTRSQILAFRRHVGALDERLPRGRRSLRRAAWAGLQDSMPRAALLSIHARVEGTQPSTWEDPSLVQLWGPRFSAYVVAAQDLAVFSLGRLPDEAGARRIAEDLAARLHALLGGAKKTYGEAGAALGEPPNRLRYAAPTGTVVMRWDGARQPDHLDGATTRRRSARRAARARSPISPRLRAHHAGVLRGVGGDRSPAGPGGVRWSPAVAHTRADAGRRRVDPHPRRADVPRCSGNRGAGTAPPERRRVLPPPRSRSRAPRSRRGSSQPALDLSSLAGRTPRQG